MDYCNEAFSGVRKMMGRTTTGALSQMGRRVQRRTSVERSEILAQGGFTPPEQIKSIGVPGGPKARWGMGRDETNNMIWTVATKHMLAAGR